MDDIRQARPVRHFEHDEREESALRGIVNFVSYHNSVPIAVSLLLLSGGSALAASPEIRTDVADAVFSQQQVVQSVDNTYLLSKDLTNWQPTIQITNVTEDADNYYVEYSLGTIDVDNYVWKDVTKDVNLTVDKRGLNGQDLGLYLTGVLRNVADAEIDRLARTQDIEKQEGAQQRQVATVYSGLIGKFLDPKEETLPGYVPVIAPSTTPDVAEGGSAPQSGGNPNVAGSNASAPSGSGPALQVLGKNPAEIPLGSEYIDLGVFVTDPNDPKLTTYTTSGDTVDTTKEGTYTITYSVTDKNGATATASRKVIVYDELKGPPIDPNTIPLVVPTIPTVQGTPAPSSDTSSSASASPSSVSGDTTASSTNTSASAATTTSDTTASGTSTASSTDTTDVSSSTAAPTDASSTASSTPQ